MISKKNKVSNQLNFIDMMRNFLLSTLVWVSATMFLHGQERNKGSIELIPQLGYSNSFLNGENVNTSDTRGALRLGVTADYYFNDRWSFRSGLLYNGMGAANDVSELQLDYLNIPLNANWHFGSTRKWNLNFGITPGFLLTAKADGVDEKEFYKSFQVGISCGIGYKLEISENFSLLFDTQGLVGITNILESRVSLNRLNAGSSLNIGGVFSF